MVNRLGIIRIAELLVAITLISVMLLVLFQRNDLEQGTPDLGETARDILSDISLQENLRAEIIGAQRNAGQMSFTRDFITGRLPSYIAYELRSCDVSSACGQSTYRGNVYSAERIISTDGSNFDPIKLRLFLWVNE